MLPRGDFLQDCRVAWISALCAKAQYPATSAALKKLTKAVLQERTYEYLARLSCSRAEEKSPIGHVFRNMRTIFPSLKRAKTTEAHS